MSKAAEEWEKVADEVRLHINNYVVPQYGDLDTELAKDWNSTDCIKQAQTYLARFGRTSRKGEERLDLLKAMHWIQKAATKLTEEMNNAQEN